MPDPVACPVIPSNFQVIVSEGLKETRGDGKVKVIHRLGHDDSVKYIMDWVRLNIEGYYLRHEGSPFDCHLIDADIFKEMYTIQPPDGLGVIFQKVVPK